MDEIAAEPDGSRFKIRKSSDDQFYHVHVSRNGEVLSQGETHPRMQGAIDNAISDGATALPLEYEN